nr:deoxyhypusine synthase [Desulfobacterales bacterium]
MTDSSAQKRNNIVDPPGITGNETIAELLESSFNAFVGRNLREAARLMKRSIDENFTVFATMSGAMTPAGLHTSSLIPLLRNGYIDVLCTTGANLYHDLHRILGFFFREISPHVDDAKLRLEKIVRIYDLAIDEKSLLDTDTFLQQLLMKDSFQCAMTTPEFHYELGRLIAQIELENKTGHSSILSACYQEGVPVFVGAPQDGSILLNAVYLSRTSPGFKLCIDMFRDIFQMAALQNLARENGGKTAIWIFGGGVPKNYTLQGEPFLGQILKVPERGFDIDVQICVDVEDNGALSGCTASEGHTWGKTSAECIETSSVYCRLDLTAALPWLTHYLLSKCSKRPSSRLIDRLNEAEEKLQRIIPEPGSHAEEDSANDGLRLRKRG